MCEITFETRRCHFRVKLDYFKAKISAYLKRHYCHGNRSCLTFGKKSNPLDPVLHQWNSYVVLFKRNADIYIYNSKMTIIFKKLCWAILMSMSKKLLWMRKTWTWKWTSALTKHRRSKILLAIKWFYKWKFYRE